MVVGGGLGVTVALSGLVLFIAATLQSAVGFGFGMFAIPLILRLGYSLSEAVTMVLSAVMIQGLTGLFKLYKDIPWKPTLRATVLRTAGIPLGILGLEAIDSAARGQVKQMVGLAILLLVVLRLLWTVPEKVPSQWWQLPSFLLSGYLVGLIGMGGPPLVLWVTAQHWQPRVTRSFLIAVFLFTLPPNLWLLVEMVGPGLADSIVRGFLFGPLVIAGALLGVWLGDKLNRDQLTKLAYGILALLGLASLFG